MTRQKQVKGKSVSVTVSKEHHHQIMLSHILKTALQPTFLKAKIEKIFDYLLGQQQLHLSNKAAFFTFDEGSNFLTLTVTKGFSTVKEIPCTQVKSGYCHCGKAIDSNTIHFSTTIPPLFGKCTVQNPFYGSYSIPILKDDEPLGILCFYVTKKHQYTPEIERFFESLANICAVIIENQQMDQQLIQLVNDLRGSIINLREEKKFSESIIQGLNHGLIVADLDGTIRKCNSVARSIFKPYTRSLDGTNLSAILDAETTSQLLTPPATESNRQDRELTLTTNTGEQQIISYSNVAREDARGTTVGVIISLSDISELKYVRKEMEKMNRLSTVAEIASAVAHEVRNPLAGIKIMAQSIEEEARGDSEQEECSQRIIRQVDRLNELLTDFFSYARPVEPNKRPVSLSVIIEETNPLIQNKLTKNHIELYEDLNPDLPKIIADPHQVQQVFLNLFLNAVDALKEKGKIYITGEFLTKNKLRTYKIKYPGLLENSAYVVVHFTDNGTGMSPEVAENVFEPFFTTKTSGAGLGLSIVYRTLKENDAAIVLKSKEGKGTTFTIFFQADI